MKSPKVDNLSKELDKLDLVAGIIGSAIVNRNGLTVISKLPRYINERSFGAMAATMFGAMEMASSTILDKISNITAEFNDYQLIILGSNNEVIIVSLIEKIADLGMIFIEIEESIKNIQTFLEGE